MQPYYLVWNKTVHSDNFKLEFFPGTLLIPERQVKQVLDIPSASFNNPTKCLVLGLDPSFLKMYTQELALNSSLNLFKARIYSIGVGRYFVSNDEATVECFKRLYQLIIKGNSPVDEIIVTLAIKELILRLYQTEARNFLMANYNDNDAGPELETAILYIKSHLLDKITINQLCRVSGLGKTNLFNRFRHKLDMSPVHFIRKERVKLSLKNMSKKSNLREIAFGCGFNNYEYFCKTFKHYQGVTPSQFKKQLNEKQPELGGL